MGNRRPARLYQDAERLIEDFFANFDLRIAPKEGCDEVAVQRVKETLEAYLDETNDTSAPLARGEIEGVFRAALTDFLYEVYFTLDDEAPAGPWLDDETAEALAALEEDLRALDDGGADDGDGELDEPENDLSDESLYAVLPLVDLCELLREDAESHADCDILAERALSHARLEGAKDAEHHLTALIDALSARPLEGAERKVLADAWYACGEVRRISGDNARAIAAYKQAARLGTHLLDVHGRLAEAFLRQGETGEALRAWAEQMERAPDDPTPFFASARLHERLDRRDRAIEVLAKLVERDPENATALDALVRLCHETERVPEAQAWRERLLAQGPPRLEDDLAVWVKHHVEAGDHDRVLEHLHAEELEQPKRPFLNLLKAVVFLAKDDPDNVEVELMLVRDKLASVGDAMPELLSSLERTLGAPRVNGLRRAVVEHLGT